MSFGWKRITAHVWRLDDTFQAVEDSPGQWRVYRGNAACLASFAKVQDCMEEAERLRKADEAYAARKV